MRLRTAIILVLCGFALGPLLLVMGANLPAVLQRLEQTSQQESLMALQNEQFALQVRVGGLRERVASLAILPGVRDIIGAPGADAISAEQARRRFAEVVAKWFADRPEAMEIRLLDRAGQDRLHLQRQGGENFVPLTGSRHIDYESAEFCRLALAAPAGTVRVGEVEVDKGDDAPHRYVLSLVTPVIDGRGAVVGGLACRLDISRFLHDYARFYWAVSGEGASHAHETAVGHHHDVHNHEGESVMFPGLDPLLVGRKAVIWNAADGGRVAWQPVSFNPDGPVTLWLGHPVDRSALTAWLQAQKLRLLAFVVLLIAAVLLLAGRVGALVERWRRELLSGLSAVFEGERPPEFRWHDFHELRQLAGELNGLGLRYEEMRAARRRAEEELRQSNSRLEETVERRTAELFATNEQLNEEVEERSRAEEELLRHRDHLEELVRQRVIELSETNERLELEIVQRRRAQDSLRENEERLRTILDSVDIGIFIVDQESRAILYANPAAAAMIGASEASVLPGLFCHDFFCLHKEEGYCPCVARGKPIHQAARTLRRVDGSPLEVLKTVIPIRMNNRACLLENLTDITELKRVSEHNQALQTQLLQSQKMEAVGVLAGGVAHDFNNLLTVIHGSAELALARTEAEAPGRRYLAQIKETTERAGNLIRQLLLFSRSQPVTRTVLALNGVVENLLKMLGRLIGEDITIETALAPDLWPIRGDAGTLEQVLMNLALNGRDAMTGGGVLRIVTENVQLDAMAAAVLPEARAGRFVVLAVADTGSGIDAEQLPRIFEPFYTTKAAGKGTGLGLAVVYGIVKQHDGWIAVASEPGQGATFKVFLPATSAGAVTAVAATEKTVPRGKGERILVVEDEELVRRLMEETLSAGGFEVFSAASVEEALALYQRLAGRVDLLVSDVVLPGHRNGLDLADALRREQPRLPVLLSSGYTDRRSRWPLIVERGFAFLQKPFSTTALLQAVAETLQGQDRT